MDKQKAGDRQSDGGLRCQTESCTDQPTVGTADKLAVGVSPLTRPDSFHADSCNGEREDRVRLRVFDVGVVLVFEGTAYFASVCSFKPLLYQNARAARRWGRQSLPVIQNGSQKQTT